MNRILFKSLIIVIIYELPCHLLAQGTDTVRTKGNQVQFLQLGVGKQNRQELRLKKDPAVILQAVKDHYASALKFWYVEQNAESAQQEYLSAIDSLNVLGEWLSEQDVADTQTNGADEWSLADDADVTENGSDDEAADKVLPAEDRLNGLVQGLVEQYRQMMEAAGQLNEDSFQARVINRLAYYELGHLVLKSHGEIHAALAKGHSLDYIPLSADNERVGKYQHYFKTNGFGTLQHLYRRIGRYEHIIREIAREEKVSEDVIYVAMIESGFSTSAKSRARAVGPWQFMKGTAQRYGLGVDWWVDERRDVYQSTRSAVRHLKDLFYEYGDWYLALAAYNAGGGRVNRAIKKNNTRDYWEMSKLPRETRKYVPFYIAAARIAKDPAAFGLTLEKDSAWIVDTVTVTECLDIQIIADCAGSAAPVIQELNPALLRWCTPPTKSSFLLKLPRGTRDTFLSNYAKIPEDKKRTWVRYQIKYGETLSLIAQKFGTDIKAIQQANSLKSSTNLITGQYLLIPVAPVTYKPSLQNDERKTVKQTASSGGYAGSGGSSDQGTVKSNVSAVKKKDDKKKDDKEGKKKVIYTVQSGNSLGEIAEWYNILPQNIRDWNNIYFGDPIYPGQKLTLWIDPYIPDEGYRKTTKKKSVEKETIDPGTKIYVVQEGDNLASIAKLFGVEVSTIKRWNKMSSNTVRVGEKLKIYLDKN